MKSIAFNLGVFRGTLYERRDLGCTPRQRQYRKAADDTRLSLVREIVDKRTSHSYPRSITLLNKKLAALRRPKSVSAGSRRSMACSRVRIDMEPSPGWIENYNEIALH